MVLALTLDRGRIGAARRTVAFWVNDGRPAARRRVSARKPRGLAEARARGAQGPAVRTADRQDLRRHPDRAAVRRGRRTPARSRRAAAPGRCRRASIIPIRPSPTPRRCTNWQNGATGLTLVFAGSVGAYGYGLPGDAKSIARVLEGVHLDAIAIELQTAEPTRGRRRSCRRAGEEPRPRARRGQHPLRPRRHRRAQPDRHAPDPLPRSDAALRRACRARWPRPGFKSPLAAADGRIIHNAGGSEAQELAYVLAVAVAYLRALEGAGIALDAARGMIEFRLSADADQFLTIAKFRALRALWARVEQACGLAPKPAFVSAETAWRMMTRRDPWVNMLRTTIAAFSAGVGGADAIDRAAVHLRHRSARPLRAPRRAQHPASAARGIQHRQGRRPGRRLRRHRGSDRQALPRRLDAVPGDRGGRRRAGGAGERPDPGQGRKGPRRARGRDRAAARMCSPAPAISRTSSEAPVQVLDAEACAARHARSPTSPIRR